MLRMKSLMLAAAFAALAIPVSAADIYTKDRPKQPPAVVLVNWSGPTIGLTVGYGFDDKTLTQSGANPLASALTSAGLYPASLATHQSGMTFGVVAGWNWRVANGVVVGVEGDYAYAKLRDTGTAGGNLLGVTYDDQIKNIWTVRARGGFLISENFLLYGTVGVAGAEVNTSIGSNGLFCTVPAFITCPTGSVSTNKTGWVWGVGGEYRWDRLSLDVSVRWYDLGSVSVPVTGRLGPIPFATTFTKDVEPVEARIALKYKF